MGFSAALRPLLGTITPGAVTRERIYDYPREPNPNLQDAPTYKEMTESWAGMDFSPPPVTKYSVDQSASPRQVRIGARTCAAMAFLKGRPDVEPGRIGALGLCHGARRRCCC